MPTWLKRLLARDEQGRPPRPRSGLVERKTADWIAAVVFLLALIALFVFLSNTSLQSFPATVTTTTSTVQTVRNARGISQQTKTVAKTKADVVPSFWQGVIGHRTPLILLIAIILFIAFLLAAAVQRVLIGQYSFSIGPLTLPEVTGEEVKVAAGSATAGIPPESQAAAAEPAPEAVWETVTDPNLALAGWRIDAERELRRIAEEYHVLPPDRARSAGSLLSLLSNIGAIAPEVVPGIREMIGLANQGVHGASVDPSVIDILRGEGRTIMKYLQSVHG